MDLLTVLNYSFIQRAFITGSFVAFTCAILGLFLVLRRLSLIGDGLSHASFGSIAVGLFIGIYPIAVAIPLVIIASLVILKLSQKTKLYGDAAIGIFSSLSIAIGVIFASISHGFNVDLFSYLFGNILAISVGEMYLSIILSVIVLLVISLFFYDLFSISFNEEQAQISGIKTNVVNYLLVTLTAVVIVLSIRVVGIMLISSLLILPAATSLQLSQSFRKTILFSIISAEVSVISGILLSFILSIPAGAAIVIANFVLFLLAIIVSKYKNSHG